MKRYGLLGRTLGHSFSPQIHSQLGDYDYQLYAVEPEGLEEFLTTTTLDGFNVTIPYKEAVLPFCTRLTPRARAVGNVNTRVRTPDGFLGDNTDYAGFRQLLGEDAVALKGEKALVLGSGGASKTVCAVLRDCGIQPVVISRSGENNYQNLERHQDAALVVNATPVGMYPKNGASPLDLRRLPACRLVLDLIYNPARTALLLQAEEMGIEGRNGLIMLVAQAARAAEAFGEQAVSEEKIREITQKIAIQTQNIVLIGMPGCGKSTVARHLGALTGRRVLDVDRLIEEKIGMDIPAFFAQHGEPAFRQVEAEVTAQAGSRSGCVIATGGGVVTVAENYASLHQNGIILFLHCEQGRLSAKNRPVTQRDGVEALLKKRLPLYRSWSRKTYENRCSKDTAAAIREDFDL